MSDPWVWRSWANQGIHHLKWNTCLQSNWYPCSHSHIGCFQKRNAVWLAWLITKMLISHKLCCCDSTKPGCQTTATSYTNFVQAESMLQQMTHSQIAAAMFVAREIQEQTRGMHEQASLFFLTEIARSCKESFSHPHSLAYASSMPPSCLQSRAVQAFCH